MVRSHVLHFNLILWFSDGLDKLAHSSLSKHGTKIVRQADSQTNKREPPMCKISFEDYFNTWRGIATSKAHDKDENPRKIWLFQ